MRNLYESSRKLSHTHQRGPHGAAGKRFLWRRQLSLGYDGFGGDRGRFAGWQRWPGRLGVPRARGDGVRRGTKRVDDVDGLGAGVVSAGFGRERSPRCLRG